MTHLRGRRWGAIWLAPALAALASAPPALEAQSLLIRNARLIDGTGAPARGPVSILVRDGRIAEIASDIAAPDVPALDAGGGTVIPGLIDAHVHLSSVPGGDVRGDDAETLRALRRAHLRSYLACGVTTVLDAATPVPAARELQGWLADGVPAPTVLMLGPPIAARGGYMSGMNPGLTVGSVEDVGRAVDAAAGVGAVGIKVPIERGFGSDAIFPIHSPEIRDAIRREAGRPAATRVPAEMLGIAADAGTVEPGKRADLVVLAGDPLERMPAIRSIRWTVKRGVARTPAQWMQEP